MVHIGWYQCSLLGSSQQKLFSLRESNPYSHTLHDGEEGRRRGG